MSSKCASGAHRENYNLGLHVGALFIILFVSAFACAIPLLALRLPLLRIPVRALFIFRHFGTGVLLATAFVHLLPTAFVNLTDPCLPAFFNQDYPAFAGAIALGSVFVITIAEMVFSPGRSLCSGPTVAETRALSEETRQRSTGFDAGDEITPAQSTPQFGRTRSGRKDAPKRLTAEQPYLDFSNHANFEHTLPSTRRSTATIDSFDTTEAFKSEQERKKLTVQCMLLECGILFHSVFIGMALAVAVGSEQVILLIAIAFHQTFEGLALGSRIAAIKWDARALQPWIMAMAYGCTTPLGQALGIATRNLYDPASETGLVIVGTMNAISAGLLTYTSLVDLLSEDFLSDDSWKSLRGRRRVFAMSLVFGGAFCMSLIGAWA